MYKPFEKVIFRFPQFPFTIFKRYLSNDSTSLVDIYSSKEFQEAIYIASPSLYEELQKYLAGHMKEEEKLKIECSLFRYFSRMSTRCTPFGTFAGVALGKIKEHTALHLDICATEKKKHTRLDMFFLCSLFQYLMNIPEIKRRTIYYANSTIYEVNNKYRYIEYYYTNSNRKHQIVEIKKDYFLSLVLKEVRQGKSYPDLIRLLINETVSEEDAHTFLNNVIDAQFIVNELEPTFVGADYLSYLISRLKEIDCTHTVVYSLNKVFELIKKLDDNTESYYECYEEIFREFSNLKIPCNKKTLFQVDLSFPSAGCSVSQTYVEDMIKGLSFLNKITDATPNSTLEVFKKGFQERYEGQEVSLLEVLDPDIGLGYPLGEKFTKKDSLLSYWSLPSNQQAGLNYVMRPIDIIMQKKLFEYNIARDTEIILTDKDVAYLRENWGDLPLTLSAKIELLDDDLYVVDGVGNPSAANLIARFSHCEKEIEEFICEITQKEQSLTGKIIAEIVHLPESRIGNVLSRPHCREYELIYLAGNSHEIQRSLSMEDLFLSVRNNKLILRSKSLNKEILPRLTSAHNFYKNPTPVYLFLCDMQLQDNRRAIFFNWGNAFQSLEYLPRVRYSNAILSLATWNLPGKEFAGLHRERKDEILLEKIKAIQKKYKLKNELLLADGDNNLYVNLSSTLSIRSFLEIIKNRSHLVLREFLSGRNTDPVYGNSIVKNECIIAFYKDEN